MAKPTWNSLEEYNDEKQRAWQALQRQVEAHDPERKMKPKELRKFVRWFVKSWTAGT